jgi:DegV family protein with EDD domain
MNKKKIGVVIDSSTTYDEKYIKDNNVEILPLCITDVNENKSFNDDGISITHETIIDGLENKKNYKTSATQVGVFLKKMEEMFIKYEDVIFIPISYGLSSQYDQAKNIIKEEFPNLHIVKSQSGALANEFILENVIEMINNKENIGTIIENSEKMYDNIFEIFSVEHIENIIRSGRILKTAVNLIKLMKIKPIFILKVSNHLSGFGKKFESIIAKMLEKIKKNFNFVLEKNKIIKIGIMHTLK